ncbi:MAG: bifunctional phosphopantothenoylcysteine decarboxylase/phosphopantothenate--cysteine ligase CoaBC [candidate division Zixibacteria bacterium]|nr:bifunctional phosphopantothenoylcysteine decarboxylase/phosphopantothenate--cysteine ligase CoaBC [candidate division Zixibacteria bacterium]
MSSLTGRHILLGITGGIAAYKSAYLCRRLKDKGADVWVSMTKNATHFITPLTMETLSEREVLLEMFPATRYVGTRHIDISDWTELSIVAPATANFIGRYANGLADDMLTTLLISVTSPVMLAPAMNTDMYNHPAVQENLQRLRARGVHMVDPTSGLLACHTVGVGRMAEPETIVAAAELLLEQSGRHDLTGKTILVTAGPTQEAIDPVRVITNRSSGKMGYAIATAAQQRGAHVILISGPTMLPAPAGIELVNVTSAQEMFNAAMARFDTCSAAIGVAAVSDWRVAKPGLHKLAKADGPPELHLEPTPDILAGMGARKRPGQIIIGFALETDPARLDSVTKLRAKNLDLLVANNPTAPGSEFGSDHNDALLIDREGHVDRPGLLTKQDLAHRILDRLASFTNGSK